MEEKNIFKKLGEKAKALLQKMGIIKEKPKMLEEAKVPVIPVEPDKRTNPFKEEIKKQAEVPLIDKYNEPEEYVFAYLKEKGLNPKILENPRGRDEVYKLVCEQFKNVNSGLGLQDAFRNKKDNIVKLENLLKNDCKRRESIIYFHKKKANQNIESGDQVIGYGESKIVIEKDGSLIYKKTLDNNYGRGIGNGANAKQTEVKEFAINEKNQFYITTDSNNISQYNTQDTGSPRWSFGKFKKNIDVYNSDGIEILSTQYKGERDIRGYFANVDHLAVINDKLYFDERTILQRTGLGEARGVCSLQHQWNNEKGYISDSPVDSYSYGEHFDYCLDNRRLADLSNGYGVATNLRFETSRRGNRSFDEICLDAEKVKWSGIPYLLPHKSSAWEREENKNIALRSVKTNDNKLSYINGLRKMAGIEQEKGQEIES